MRRIDCEAEARRLIEAGNWRARAVAAHFGLAMAQAVDCPWFSRAVADWIDDDLWDASQVDLYGGTLTSGAAA